MIDRHRTASRNSDLRSTPSGFHSFGNVTVAHSGQEVSYSAGEVYEINAGHDAWVVGDTPVVAYEFSGSWA